MLEARNADSSFLSLAYVRPAVTRVLGKDLRREASTTISPRGCAHPRPDPRSGRRPRRTRARQWGTSATGGTRQTGLIDGEQRKKKKGKQNELVSVLRNRTCQIAAWRETAVREPEKSPTRRVGRWLINAAVQQPAQPRGGPKTRLPWIAQRGPMPVNHLLYAVPPQSSPGGEAIKTRLHASLRRGRRHHVLSNLVGAAFDRSSEKALAKRAERKTDSRWRDLAMPHARRAVPGRCGRTQSSRRRARRRRRS